MVWLNDHELVINGKLYHINDRSWIENIIKRHEEKYGERFGCDEVLPSSGEDSDIGLHNRDNDAVHG